MIACLCADAHPNGVVGTSPNRALQPPPPTLLRQIPKTTHFIANGNFQRVALQFPDPLLREAPEVLWTLQARLRKLKAGQGRDGGDGVGAEPFIFVTGDTSYGSCCVDEVNAQHLKADAIVHYGKRWACTQEAGPVAPVYRGCQHLCDRLVALLVPLAGRLWV